MVPRSVSVPKACVYPFNSSRLQRHTLGKMDTSCSFCGALKWLDERVTGSTKRSPVFTTCCAQGKVLLPCLQEPPAVLKSYLMGDDASSREFQQNIRAYNSALAFTSIGAKIDDNITGTRGPYTFHIHSPAKILGPPDDHHIHHK